MSRARGEGPLEIPSGGPLVVRGRLRERRRERNEVLRRVSASTTSSSPPAPAPTLPLLPLLPLPPLSPPLPLPLPLPPLPLSRLTSRRGGLNTAPMRPLLLGVSGAAPGARVPPEGAPERAAERAASSAHIPAIGNAAPSLQGTRGPSDSSSSSALAALSSTSRWCTGGCPLTPPLPGTLEAPGRALGLAPGAPGTSPSASPARGTVDAAGTPAAYLGPGAPGAYPSTFRTGTSSSIRASSSHMERGTEELLGRLGGSPGDGVCEVPSTLSPEPCWG